jgi:hypothetical protein
MPCALAQSLISVRNFTPIGSNSAGDTTGFFRRSRKKQMIPPAAGSRETYPLRYSRPVQETSSVTCPATISAALTAGAAP